MEVVTYAKIIGRYWWLVVLTAVISTGFAAAISLTKSPSYSVQARVVAKPATSVLTQTNDLVNTLSEMTTRSVIGTYAQIFSSADVQAEAQSKTGLNPVTAKDYPLQANVLPDTTVIEVSGKGGDPKLLADYVNATINAAVSRAPSLFRVIELQPLEMATIPTVATSPNPTRDIPIGGGLGLVLGMMLALVIEYLRTPKRVEQQYEPQIRSLVPTNVLPSLAPPNSTGQQEMRVINGGQQRQEYLVPGRQQQRTGWQANPNDQNSKILQPTHRDDSFPG